MIQIIFWVLLGLCSALGMAIIPIHAELGAVIAFGCFLVLALDIARNFVWATIIGVMDQTAIREGQQQGSAGSRAIKF